MGRQMGCSCGGGSTARNMGSAKGRLVGLSPPSNGADGTGRVRPVVRPLREMLRASDFGPDTPRRRTVSWLGRRRNSKPREVAQQFDGSLVNSRT